MSEEREREHGEEAEEAQRRARVALKAVREVKTLSELSSTYGVHPTVIAQWKRQLLDGAAGVFSRANGTNGRSEEEISAPLYEEIGRLKVELDWLKKKL